MRFVVPLSLVVLLVLSLPAMAAEPPGLMYSTLLNGVKMLHEDGRVTLDRIQAVFLPDAQSNTIYPYNPDDGGKLWAIVSTAGGTEIYRCDFYAELLKQPYWLLNSYKLTDLRSGTNIADGWLDLSAPGDYVLDFFLESGRFYTFPFSVSKLTSDDPFAGGDFYFLDGPWADWAYLYYRDADPTRSLYFKVWLRNYQHGPDRDVKPLIEIHRGGTLICTSREITLGLKPEWTRYEFDMIFPMEGTSGGAYFKAQDLLATDGDYTLKLSLSGEHYGTWNFKVGGGKLNYVWRTVRGEADPLTFVEGGRDAWWYEK